ncbi:PVC-type heme-binding CxxCH protein [Tundrisphaera lichenicola]|uniref:PVC-type heme-binding CxxCH protein n=1 Tax=Tundrisphaera lichenicola TaxID=2029860 RepID=UPI003EC1014C
MILRPDLTRTFDRLIGLVVVAISGLFPPGPAIGSAGREGLVELGTADPRLKGYHVAKGLKVRVVADGTRIADPVAMAFDDSGDLFVAEWRPSGPNFDAWDTLSLPGGGNTRVRKTRKPSVDLIRRLRDIDGDGVYESSEIVLDGVEMPTAILPHQGGLILASLGRLERWTDRDGDGTFETRQVLADGFPATGSQSLGGLTLGTDGWLYLTAGDGESNVVGSDGSRVGLSGTGGVYRCRPDGSQMSLFARGFRDPSRGLAFDPASEPWLLDEGTADGTKFQGVRLIRPMEEGDHGWRLGTDRDGLLADFDRGAADGERPGRLGAVARLGRGSPSGLVFYRGSSLPEPLRGAILYPDTHRKSIQGIKTGEKSGRNTLLGELTLVASDDPQFRPVQIVEGADGAIFVLDRRAPSGRILRLSWSGDRATPAFPARPNHWKRVLEATDQQRLLQMITGADRAEAERAQREAVGRGPEARTTLLTLAGKVGAPLHSRILGLQGARQFWDDEVEKAFVKLLGDPEPAIRRLAAQGLSWEAKQADPRLVPRLAPLLDDPDCRVVREAVLALGRHAEPSPRATAALLVRRLYAHPEFDRSVQDAFLRSLERMGVVGVDEVSLAVRTRTGTDRSRAVSLFAGFRSAPAADQLMSLIKIPDIGESERLVLIRQFRDFPAEVSPPTGPLADWVIGHSEAAPALKLAGLDACLLAGNPASNLVLALLDDKDSSVRRAAIRVAAVSKPPGALARLSDRLREKDRSPIEKREIARSLGHSGPEAFAALDETFLASDDPVLRKLAIRSMATIDWNRSLPALESALTGRDPVVRSEGIRILGESSATAAMLGKAYQARAMGRENLPAVLQALRIHESPEIRAVRSSIEESASRETPSITHAEIRERLPRDGDPWSGLGLFYRDSVNRCSACHAIKGRGGTSGPDLTLGSQLPDPGRMIGAILRHPSLKLGPEAARPKDKDKRAEVDPDRDPALGRTSTGAAPTPHPGRSAIELTTDEIIHLAAFLLSKPAQDSLERGPRTIDKALVAGPFERGADKLRIPLDRVDLARPLIGQDGLPTEWSMLEADDSGTLSLRGEFGSKPGRAYLAVQVRSDREQSAALRFAIRGAARVYLDGVKVADSEGLDSSAPFPHRLLAEPGEPQPLTELAHLPLKVGWNLLIVALDRDWDSDARVGLEIASPLPVELRLPKN